jgi:toxin-antitoxin system PIN domain toxin
MIVPDVNVLVLAMRPDASDSGPEVRTWLQARLAGHEQVGVPEQVLASVVRLVTNPRIFAEPSTPGQAIEFADAVLEAPASVAVRPGARHWALFSGLVTSHRLRDNDVPDAYLAAVVMEAGAHLATLDRGFRRFDGLRTMDPLAAG